MYIQHACIQTHSYIHMTLTYIHTYIRTSTHACMHTYIHACIHACMHAQTYRHAYMHRHVDMHYICIHAHIHVQVHTCTIYAHRNKVIHRPCIKTHGNQTCTCTDREVRFANPWSTKASRCGIADYSTRTKGFDPLDGEVVVPREPCFDFFCLAATVQGLVFRA